VSKKVPVYFPKMEMSQRYEEKGAGFIFPSGLLEMSQRYAEK
jgi:hypothetical protein